MKITKTKVLTVLLIIAVVIIAVLSVKLLSKEDDNPVNQPEEVVVNNEQLEEKKDEPLEEEKKIEGEKLLQFDTEFYKLEDVALEWRDSEKVKNYKDFNYDLDGDGVVDKVTMKWDKEKEGELILTLNGVEFARTYGYPRVYIVDLNEDDKNIEVVAVEQDHMDIESVIYSKVNGKITTFDYTYGRLKTNKKGIIIDNDVFGGTVEPRVYSSYIFINNGMTEIRAIENMDILKNVELKTDYSLAFSENIENFSEFKTLFLELSESDYDIKVKKCVEKSNVEFMTEDMSFKILDLSSRYVQLKDGRKGYLEDLTPWIAG